MWPNYWSFYFNISPSNDYSGLISFRIDWLDLLAVQGTLKRLLQHHMSKASILQRSAFFIVHLSHPYKTTGKTIALTRQTFVGKVMSLFLICYLGWSQLFSIIAHWNKTWFPPQSVFHQEASIRLLSLLIRGQTEATYSTLLLFHREQQSAMD